MSKIETCPPPSSRDRYGGKTGALYTHTVNRAGQAETTPTTRTLNIFGTTIVVSCTSSSWVRMHLLRLSQLAIDRDISYGNAYNTTFPLLLF